MTPWPGCTRNVFCTFFIQPEKKKRIIIILFYARRFGFFFFVPNKILYFITFFLLPPSTHPGIKLLSTDRPSPVHAHRKSRVRATVKISFRIDQKYKRDGIFKKKKTIDGRTYQSGVKKITRPARC